MAHAAWHHSMTITTVYAAPGSPSRSAGCGGERISGVGGIVSMHIVLHSCVFIFFGHLPERFVINAIEVKAVSQNSFSETGSPARRKEYEFAHEVAYFGKVRMVKYFFCSDLKTVIFLHICPSGRI